MKNTNFVISLLRCNQSFHKWVQIIKYFYTHCKLLKFMIRDMLFPTKLTSLINTPGLIASLENHHNNRCSSRGVVVGATSYLKPFLEGVYV